MQINKEDEFYFEIRDAINEEKIKLYNITLAKCSIQNEALYYKNRL